MKRCVQQCCLCFLVSVLSVLEGSGNSADNRTVLLKDKEPANFSVREKAGFFKSYPASKGPLRWLHLRLCPASPSILLGPEQETRQPD
jgi:hypothetical protein